MTGILLGSIGLHREPWNAGCSPNVLMLRRTSAWFGDLKDGIHKGDANDPRASVIEVIPDEIRYWHPNKGKVGQAIDIGVHALTGKVSSPGELCTISKEEVGSHFLSNFLARNNHLQIQLAQGLN